MAEEYYSPLSLHCHGVCTYDNIHPTDAYIGRRRNVRGSRVAGIIVFRNLKVNLGHPVAESGDTGKDVNLQNRRRRSLTACRSGTIEVEASGCNRQSQSIVTD